jgi:2-keto-4-pentenoate hydratase
MNERFDPTPASILADAWRGGTFLTELPAAVRPRTLGEGYDIQDLLIEALRLPVAGWKLGVGSTVQKQQSGVGLSIAGRISGSRLDRSGDTVPPPNAAPVTIEFEIAYVLGRDVLPEEEAFPVLQAVAEARSAFELVLSRCTDRRAVGWPSFAADNGAFHAPDGKEAARSLTGEDITDPVAALADLVAAARV